MHLKGVNHFNILICGRTRTNGKNLIELAKQNVGITRLSIMGSDVNDSANCQGFTHLNIRGIKTTAEALLKIKELKVIKSDLDYDSNKKIREAGLKLIHDSYIFDFSESAYINITDERLIKRNK